jgi:hypothetical protein
MYVGTVIKLKEEAFGEAKDSHGFCCQIFESKKKFMSSFIFEGGNLVHLNIKKQNEITKLLGFKDELSIYQFENDEYCKQDYEEGVFDEVLKNKNFTHYKFKNDKGVKNNESEKSS